MLKFWHRCLYLQGCGFSGGYHHTKFVQLSVTSGKQAYQLSYITSPSRVLWECFSSWSNSNFMEKLQRHTENCCEPFTQLLLLKQTQDFFLLKWWSKSVKWDSLMIRSNHQYFFLKLSPTFTQGEGKSGNLCSKSFSIGKKPANSVGMAWWLVKNATSCGKKLVSG